ncbi:hypothetical protein DUT91_03560 [Phyllobacterium salinisoli]|uniref:Uncharacterized protein n=1 Tax=Phyllobacterium salinisoli TaxID=1899321 RepID=A0A368K907_9HYPH|nr:hypothetical protein [Phyllobacterium salinisoli]RCS25848.1 hypothetical protein DUT91_03560 [Phyllobacterium salinisoli]
MIDENAEYRITSLVYDTDICDQTDAEYTGNIPPGQMDKRVELTAAVLDDQNNPPTTPQTVYWSCPRSVVQFSDKTGTITSTSITDAEAGGATIYASCSKPALAMISASLIPDGDLSEQFFMRVVFCNITLNSDSPFAAPKGGSLIQIPLVYHDNTDSYYYNFRVIDNTIGKVTGLVAGWTAQIDRYGIPLEKTLLFPLNHLSGSLGPPPVYWPDLYTRGIDVPYQVMNSDSSSYDAIVQNEKTQASAGQNVVQYLYQDGVESPATVSTWFPYEATGVAWAQPDPNKLENPSYLIPILWNPNTKQEEDKPTVITNDYFWWDETHKAYWLIFKIHTDALNQNDKVFPYLYANGFVSDTDQRVSYSHNIGEHIVTKDINGNNSEITLMIPSTPLVNIAKGSGNNYGSLEIDYLVNEFYWSHVFSAPTDFDPDDLEPPSREASSTAK